MSLKDVCKIENKQQVHMGNNQEHLFSSIIRVQDKTFSSFLKFTEGTQINCQKFVFLCKICKHAMCLPPVSLSILSTLHCLHSFNRQTQNMDQLLQQSLLLHLLIPGEQNLMQWANLARDSKIVKASSVRWVDMAWIKERKQYQTHLNLYIFFIVLQRFFQWVAYF